MLSRFRTHQQILLFSGAGVLTCFILLTFALSLTGALRSYLGDERQTFSRDRALVLDRAYVSAIRVRLAAVQGETVWEASGLADSEVRRRFDAQGGQLVFPSPSDVNLPLLLRLPGASRTPDDEVRRILMYAKGPAGFSRRQMKSQSEALYMTWQVKGYVVFPSMSIVGIAPPPDLSDPRVAGAIADRQRLARYYLAGLDNFDQWAVPREGARELRWLPPEPDPVTGQMYYRVAAVMFDGSRPFGVVVGQYMPERLIESIVPGSFAGTYMIVDARGVPVVSTSAPPLDNAAIRQVLAEQKANASSSELTERYADGAMTISMPLARSGWSLVYVLPRNVIMKTVARRIAGTASATALALVLLWTFVILFNRKVVAPLFERSERVFDSEHLSRTLIETAPVGLALVNVSDNTVLLESAHMLALEARVGARDGTLIGDVLKRHAPAAFLEQRGSRATTADLQLSLPGDDGGMIDLAAKLTPAHYQGRPVVVAAFSDVTAERRLARQLTAAKQAADSANAAKTAFLAAMSHEIRTPLNAILGHLELLERLPQAAPVAGRVRTVASSSRALLDVLNDILDFSKVEAGEMSFESIRFDLARLISEAVAMLMPLAQRKGIALNWSIDPALPRHYVGDPGRIRQIVVNLVGNAIKFTDDGHVSIDVRADGGGLPASPVVIAVTDTGIGIAADRQVHIFDAFDQADVSITRRFGGTGLGLALCKRIAESMGGAIAVDSEVGWGSTFTVTLPISPDDHMAVDVETEGGTPDADADMRGIHVLVAEDHEVNRELIRDQLDALGYTCDIVENGLVALRYFNERHYDLVLTDLAMPVMDGYTLATCLRNQGARTPIIAITADVTAANTRRAQEAGISGVLLKPMSLASIDAVARKHLKLATDPHAAAAIVAAAERSIVLSPALVAALDQRTGESLSAIDDAMARGDWETVGSRVHSIKGAFAMIHEQAVVDACVRLEDVILHAPDVDGGRTSEALAEVRTSVALALQRIATDLESRHAGAND
ncbi:response regulator [Burkholderia territorii]|uniref:histidine kinase n=1 Tax=Burkholderia territorii TaxID=1503055 RepID=A0A6L3NQ42_9BURK|nr:response regulator [Burkholderia territorii]MBM2773272.1 response regulator [Burkholderia territorii]